MKLNFLLAGSNRHSIGVTSGRTVARTADNKPTQLYFYDVKFVFYIISLLLFVNKNF